MLVGSKLHILLCETRPPRHPQRHTEPIAAKHLAADLMLDASADYVRTLAHYRAHYPRRWLVVHNVCVGRPWEGFMTKMHALSDYLASSKAAPKDLVLFADSDVLWNRPLSADEVAHRFDAALSECGRSCRVIFQAEAWCHAPWVDRSNASCSKAHFWCSPHTRTAYRALGYPRVPSLCHGLLNSGGFVGRAKDLARVVNQWIQPPSSWPKLPVPLSDSGLLGPVGACSGTGFDQCLATHLLLRSNGTIGIDVRERFFATGAVATGPGQPRTRRHWPNLAWKDFCGSEPAVDCGASYTPQWLAVNGTLVRPPAYQAQCQLEPRGPMLVHFNGPSKWEQSHRMFRGWVAATKGSLS